MMATRKQLPSHAQATMQKAQSGLVETIRKITKQDEASQRHTLRMLERAEEFGRYVGWRAALILAYPANEEIGGEIKTLMLEKATATRTQVYALLQHGVCNEDDTTMQKGMELYARLSERGKMAVARKMERLLANYAYAPWESAENAIAIERIAGFFETAQRTENQKAKLDSARQMLKRIAEEEGELSEEEKTTRWAAGSVREACAKALWALDYSDLDFWKARLADEDTQEAVAVKMLEEREGGWPLLARYMEQVGGAIVQSEGKLKWEFFRWIFEKEEREVALRAVPILERCNELPEDIREHVVEGRKEIEQEETRQGEIEEARRAAVEERRQKEFLGMMGWVSGSVIEDLGERSVPVFVDFGGSRGGRAERAIFNKDTDFGSELGSVIHEITQIRSDPEVRFPEVEAYIRAYKERGEGREVLEGIIEELAAVMVTPQTAQQVRAKAAELSRKILALGIAPRKK